MMKMKCLKVMAAAKEKKAREEWQSLVSQVDESTP